VAEFLNGADVVDDDDGVDRGVEDGPVLQPLTGPRVALGGASGCLGVLARHLNRRRNRVRQC